MTWAECHHAVQFRHVSFARGGSRTRRCASTGSLVPWSGTSFAAAVKGRSARAPSGFRGAGHARHIHQLRTAL